MDTLPDDPAPAKPRRRGGLIAFVVVVVLLGVGVGVAHRPVIEWWIRREALRRGFELDFANVSIVPDRVVLRQTRVRLVGVPGLDARFGELVVDLQGIDPIRIQAKEALVDVTGAPEDLRGALIAFVKQRGESVRLPAITEGDVRYGGRDNPSVVFSGNTRSKGDGDLTFDGSLRVLQWKLDKVAMHRSKEGRVDVQFGTTAAGKPLVNVLLEADAQPIKGSVTFASMIADDIARALALQLPKGLGSPTVEGSLSFVLDGALPKTPHHGAAAFVLTGWVPPHPKELDGIVFGRTTKLGATFEISPDLGEVRFTKATVDAGALHLEGKGNAVRDGLSARTRMDLSGNVPCSELGASAVGSHVPGLVGDLLRGVARMTMGGTVNIRVTADVDTKALNAAKIDQAVDIGCRLR
jgi:hypothetical protein